MIRMSEREGNYWQSTNWYSPHPSWNWVVVVNVLPCLDNCSRNMQAVTNSLINTATISWTFYGSPPTSRIQV